MLKTKQGNEMWNSNWAKPALACMELFFLAVGSGSVTSAALCLLVVMPLGYQMWFCRQLWLVDADESILKGQLKALKPVWGGSG